MSTTETSDHTAPTTGNEWWRTAVIYQIYPRSFADSSGDGVGDLRGITQHLSDLENLGIDAIWLSPFMTSPQKDAGYDVANYCDVDPLFGTLADFDAMLAEAHLRNIRVIIDLVPNHSSDQHRWFQQALQAAPGSAERERYMFRDGKGETGELAPNNWESVFGGPAWTRITEPDGTLGQWYLHLFDSSQPDFNWNNEVVREGFRRVLRFWLDRGVDGFRVDVAHGMIKADGLPDYTPNPEGGSMGGDADEVPYWGQDGVHDIYRDWHILLAEYSGDRALCGEAWLPTIEKTTKWVRQGEMHQTFNFQYLETPWQATAQRNVITESLKQYGAVGAPSTWVLSNHDVVRHATRLAVTFDNPQGEGIGPKTPGPRPDAALGLKRARAATSMMLALPGSAYLYQGEELGLPEAIDLPDEARQDPTWFRTNFTRYGRDGCRVPLPWVRNAPALGFSQTGKAWLPQPVEYADLSRDVERGVKESTLTLYQSLLTLRQGFKLGSGTLEWIDEYGSDVVAFRNGEVEVITNFGSAPVELTDKTVIASSQPGVTDSVATDVTVWVRNL